MKKFVIAGIAAAAFCAAPALAADIPSRPIYKAPTMQPVFTWTGFYVGGFAGYGSARANWDQPGFAVATDQVEPRGAFYGGLVGYNWQVSPNWVLGVEVDAAFANMTAGKNGPGILASQIEDKVVGFSTARVRAGYAFGMDMIYVTGGYAWLSNKTNISVPGTVNQVDATHNGWAAGAGWEHAFDNHWSIKAEYLYLSFETKNYLYPSFLPALPFNTSLNIQTGKLGVNYRF